jgi:hypothetical protein
VGDRDENGWRLVKVESLEYLPSTGLQNSEPKNNTSILFGFPDDADDEDLDDEDLDDDENDWPQTD